MLDDPSYAQRYGELSTKAAKLKSFRSALHDQTVKTDRAGKKQTYDSFIKQYQLLIKKPATAIKKEEYSFQELIDWQKVPPPHRPHVVVAHALF